MAYRQRHVKNIASGPPPPPPQGSNRLRCLLCSLSFVLVVDHAWLLNAKQAAAQAVPAAGESDGSAPCCGMSG